MLKSPGLLNVTSDQDVFDDYERTPRTSSAEKVPVLTTGCGNGVKELRSHMSYTRGANCCRAN